LLTLNHDGKPEGCFGAEQSDCPIVSYVAEGERVNVGHGGFRGVADVRPERSDSARRLCRVSRPAASRLSVLKRRRRPRPMCRSSAIALDVLGFSVLD
jgi:hypothetical protein